MKKLFLVLLLIAAGCGQESTIIAPNEVQTDGYPQRPFVELTIENGQFADHDSTYSFEVYAKANIEGIYMGNTTIALYVENEFPFAALTNPSLTYANPKFTLGSPGYGSMFVAEYYEKEKGEFGLYLQALYYPNQGEGSEVSTTKEKIAVIKTKVTFCVFDIVYDSGVTFFKDTGNQTIQSGKYGHLSGCQATDQLPVHIILQPTPLEN